MSIEPMPTVICTVDVVLLTLQGSHLQVLLLKRDRDPFAGALALPGGYVHPQDDQDTADAARRVLHDKAGLSGLYLEQLASFSGPGRDPRGWSLSVAYCALVHDAAMASLPEHLWRPVHQLPALPFDHARIVAAAVQRVRSKSQYSSLPVHLCGDTFTLPQLQAVYEALLGSPINKVSFRRKMDELAMLEPIAGAMTQGAAHRPAQLYRLKGAFQQALSTIERGL